ncbi:hypothetical protein GUJ93_ZPchr0001g31800 [Zizania palustris]|uniref:Uncharacterized protein n=1 Tax=Zizania palustris TaxID=103762 RepID=A0A8J5S038_ZIZPA|nr:hypothetical protein GUJ93_ZPchr0001g31800 [Zizania palustris]
MSASDSGEREAGPAFSLDPAAAARRLLAFLRSAHGGGGAVGLRSVWRYEELWMPLAAGSAGEGGEAAMLVPPYDVQLVWLCHCFHHESYASYCASRFGRLINRPSILDADNEEYAVDRCRDVWAAHYPLEPFDLDDNNIEGNSVNDNSTAEIVKMVQRYTGLAAQFASPFILEGVYHVAARRRYRCFLDLIKKTVCTIQGNTRLVPSLDILLMWLAHQCFPVSYATDMAAMAIGDNVAKVVVGYGEVVNEEMVEMTKVLWEEAYDEPYDTAGSEIDMAEVGAAREAFYWEAAAASEQDANRQYKGLQPRFIMEVYLMLT